MNRRVVVTGLGTVNPIALSVPEYQRNLFAGKNGIAPITLIDASTYKVRFAGEVKGFRTDPVIDERSARKLDRYSHFALVAAAEAVADCGFDFKHRSFSCRRHHRHGNRRTLFL